MASLAGDLLVGRALGRGRSPSYLLRLALDTLDVAVWVPVGKQDATTSRGALLVSVPHAMEAGYAIGASGQWTLRSIAKAFAIPVVTTGAAVLVRRRKGLGMGSTQVFWGVMGAGMTALLGRHERLERCRAQAAADEIVAARARSARLQGEAEIALGGAGGPPHDLKKELLVLASNGSSIAQGAAQELMGRKQHLAERTAAFGAYIGELLTGVTFDPEDAWSVRLTSDQAERLRAEIDERGRPDVVRLINEPEARRPGGRVGLELDGRSVELDGQAPPRHWLADPAPLAFLMSGVWRLTASLPEVGPIPWSVALPGAAAEIVGMLAYRSAPVPTDPTAPLKAAFVSAVAYGAAAVRRAQFNENGEGEQIFPASCAFHGYGLVAARYWDDFTPAQRPWVVASASVVGAVAFLGGPERIQWSSLAQEIPFALVPCFALFGFDRRKKAAVEMLVAELQTTIERDIDRSRTEGRAAEIALTEAYVDRAEAALAELGSRLDPADATDIRAKCGEARAWLTAAQS